MDGVMILVFDISFLIGFLIGAFFASVWVYLSLGKTKLDLEQKRAGAELERKKAAADPGYLSRHFGHGGYSKETMDRVDKKIKADDEYRKRFNKDGI